MSRPASFEVTESIYDGALGSGWQDYGWGAHDLAHGPARINLTQYGGFILRHDPLQTRFGALVFRMLAASDANFLRVQLGNGDDKSFPAVDVGSQFGRAQAGGWIEYYVPWTLLNPQGKPFDRIVLHARTLVQSASIQFDKIGLTRFDPALASAVSSGPTKRAKLAVMCRSAGHSISPYIYGLGGNGDPGPIGVSARRWGGNPMTRYNWQLGTAYNVAKDWYFENGKTEDYRDFLKQSRALHAISALTVPMIGWVAKDTSSYGFPVSVLGQQRAHDPNRPDVGDGTRPDGTLVMPGSPAQTSVAAPPEMMQKWVEAIHQQDQKDGARSVQLYILDNEPSLWNSTHRDVHPDPLTYDELRDRTLRYSAAIRAADPQALIAGPAEWGWTGYFYSAADLFAGVQRRPDRRAHGDVPLIPWYLKQLHDRDRATGSKSIDVLDVHFYPQEQNVYSAASDPATAALRLRSTRSLWDPSYKDESWINDTIRLIPRLKEWVTANYPGLAISIGEYNFGGEQDISGALALAEALGRFGSEGVDYAFYWTYPPRGSAAYWAFRAFRNFDDRGGRFLDRSIDVHTNGDVSLFASRDASGTHLVLVALNLDPANAVTTSIELNGCAAIASYQKYVYDGSAKSITASALRTGQPLAETLAPYSINVFDVLLK